MLGCACALIAGFKKILWGVVIMGLSAKAGVNVLAGGLPKGGALKGVALNGRDILDGGGAFSGGGIVTGTSLKGRDLFKGIAAFDGGGFAIGAFVGKQGYVG